LVLGAVVEGNRDVATGDYITAEVCLCKCEKNVLLVPGFDSLTDTLH